MSCTPSQILLNGGLTDARIKQTYVVVFQFPQFLILIVLLTYVRVWKSGAETRRTPSLLRAGTRRTPPAAGDHETARTGSVQPAAAQARERPTAPADCRHVTSRANRERPGPGTSAARPPSAPQTRAGNSWAGGGPRSRRPAAPRGVESQTAA